MRSCRAAERRKLAKIKKRSGEMQEFDKRKLEQSVKSAGASEEVARRVAEKITPSEGLSTEELRRSVSQELKRENESLSGAYTGTRRLRAKEAKDLSSGVVRLNEELLKTHGLQSGQHAHLMNKDMKTEVRVEPAKSADREEIQMSHADLEKLGVSEGSRVNVRFSADSHATCGSGKAPCS